MSIVNEALKKAAREDAKEPLSEKQGFSFSVKTSFIRTFFLRSIPVLFLFFQRLSSPKGMPLLDGGPSLSCLVFNQNATVTPKRQSSIKSILQFLPN
jgi:hypothetical protein